MLFAKYVFSIKQIQHNHTFVVHLFSISVSLSSTEVGLWPRAARGAAGLARPRRGHQGRTGELWSQEDAQRLCVHHRGAEAELVQGGGEDHQAGARHEDGDEAARQAHLTASGSQQGINGWHLNGHYRTFTHVQCLCILMGIPCVIW